MPHCPRPSLRFISFMMERTLKYKIQQKSDETGKSMSELMNEAMTEKFDHIILCEKYAKLAAEETEAEKAKRLFKQGVATRTWSFQKKKAKPDSKKK